MPRELCAIQHVDALLVQISGLLKPSHPGLCLQCAARSAGRGTGEPIRNHRRTQSRRAAGPSRGARAGSTRPQCSTRCASHRELVAPRPVQSDRQQKSCQHPSWRQLEFLAERAVLDLAVTPVTNIKGGRPGGPSTHRRGTRLSGILMRVRKSTGNVVAHSELVRTSGEAASAPSLCSSWRSGSRPPGRGNHLATVSSAQLRVDRDAGELRPAPETPAVGGQASQADRGRPCS